MSRLIDADAFLKRNEVYADCEFNHPKYQDTLREIVEAEPTVDAVEVVRCKDCVLFEPNTFPIRSGHPCCRVGLEPDDFCSWAETEYEVDDE